ncbi:hypothetical protein [Streptomyces sp. NPDC058252]
MLDTLRDLADHNYDLAAELPDGTKPTGAAVDQELHTICVRR